MANSCIQLTVPQVRPSIVDINASQYFWQYLSFLSFDCPVNTWKVLFQPHKEGVVATTGQSGGVTFWNAKTGSQLSVIKTPSSAFTTALAFVRILLFVVALNLILINES